MSQTKAQLINAVDGSIVTADLADDAVTAAKLAHTSVTAGSYTTADITVDAQGRVTAAASGTISNAEIADGAITNAKVNASAAIAGSKISPSFTANTTITAASPVLRLADSTDPQGTDGIIGKLEFFGNDGSSGGADVRSFIQTISTNSVGNAHALTIGLGESNNAPTEKVRILGDGKIGIGTTSPAEELVVRADAPSIQLESSNASGRNYGLQANNDGKFHAYDGTAGANRVTLDSSGNVGIGTTSPNRHLHLHESDSTGAVVRFTNTTTGSGENDGLTVGINSSEQAEFWQRESTAMVFGTNNAERMRLFNNGKLALGAGAIAEPKGTAGGSFDLSNGNITMCIGGDNGQNGSRTNSTDKLFRITGSHYTNAEEPFGVVIGFCGSSDSRLLYGGGSTQVNAVTQHRFFTATNTTTTSGTERMRIDSSGNVGIGTTSPERQLHVLNSSGDALVRITSADGNAAYLELGDASDRDAGKIVYDNGDNLTFSTANSGSTTEKLRIQGNGNVGIGTTSPSRLLHQHVSSSAANYHSFTNDTTGSGSTDGLLIGINNNEDSFVWNYENTNLRFGTNNSERMRIDMAGRLLIGHSVSQTIGSNSHPLVQLNVNSNQQVLTLARFENSSAGPSMVLGKSRASSAGNYTVVQNGDILGSIQFSGADGTDLISRGAAIEAQVDGTPGSNDMPGRLVFMTTADGSDSPTERMRINANGYASIGTTGNSYQLHVKGGIVDQTARFDNTKTGDGDINYIGIGLNTTTTGSALFGHTGHTTTGSQAAWMGLGGDDVAGGTGVKVFRGGNVVMMGRLGIGTSSPSSKLEVRATTATHQLVSINRANTDTGALFLGCNSSSQPIIAGNNADIIFGRDQSNSFAERMRLRPDGKLLLNRSNLDGSGMLQIAVSGAGITTATADQGTVTHLEFRNQNGNVGTIKTNGTGTSFNTSSDYRLKENVIDLTNGITRLKQLKPKKFNFISDETNTLLDGFLAHEVSPIIPEAISGEKDEVDTDGKPLYQEIDHSKLVPLLTASLQEAISKIETLETKVAALEAA